METKVLDHKETQKVEYCIPTWLRDLQIEQNIERVKGRVVPGTAFIDDPIAIVCFGPSLNDTWEQLKDYKYIMTCSGAHKFLIDHGIIPTHHVDVDPRPHKIELLGKPQKETEYLISSTCSPKLIDFLEGFNVKLWHVFDGEAEGRRILPIDEWALLGGCNVGVRCLTIARFLGFRNQHVFGMDGNEGKTGKHAAFHPNQPPGNSICNYNGVEYKTTPAFLESAKNTFHELNQMPDVKATFFGEGLVQAMAKDYIPKPADPQNQIIGFMKPKLISDEYRKLNKQLHESNVFYGVGGQRHTKTVLELFKQIKPQVENPSVLDYGCGKGMLAKSLPFPIWEYDPAVPGKEDSPKAANLVVCTDVLEHIEPDLLGLVLDDLRRCTIGLGFFVIDTKAAIKTLPDGRNTHLIQKDMRWWKKHLEKFFTVHSIKPQGSELFCIVGPQSEKIKKGKVKSYVVGDKSEMANKDGQPQAVNAGS